MMRILRDTSLPLKYFLAEVGRPRNLRRLDFREALKKNTAKGTFVMC
jgi:hypothetical protein